MSHRSRTRGARPRLRLEHLEGRDVPAVIGALDPSFGTGGLVTTDFGAVDQARAVAVQPDGKIVAVGVGAGGVDFAVARYNPDGTLDTTFGGGDGKVTIPVTIGDAATGVAVQADGKIVVVGFTDDGVDTDFAVVRILADGAGLDLTFDTDGKQIIDFGGMDKAAAVAVQGDGRIVIAGSTSLNNDFAVARLKTDGTLDTSFSTDGKDTPTFGGVETAAALAVQADGKIVVAGRTDQGGAPADNFAVLRYNADGTLDNTFDTDGKLTIDLGGDDGATGVAVQADGKIVVAGSTSSNNDFAVARLNADGSLDNTFDTDGKVTPTFGGTDVATGVAIQPDGKIVVAGLTDQGGGVADNFAVARLNTDGSFDTSFDTDGKATADLGGDDEGAAVALDENGRIVVAGTSGGDFALARLTGTVEQARGLAVGGSLDGVAQTFTPDPATGNYVAAGPVAGLGATAANARVAVGDVDGDGTEDTILITGPGTAIRLAVVSGADGTTPLVAPFDPFGGGFVGGGFVAAADFDNDGRAEVVVTPDQGGGPRVVIFSLVGGTFVQRASFFGIADPGFRGGARAAAGDVDADGIADLAVAAGFGGGPRVALYDGETVLDGATPTRLIGDFLAFEDVLRNGVYVAIGDVTGDGFGDLIFGAGPGGAPRLLTISGQALLTTGAVAAIASPVSNFFVAGNDADRGGVRVAATDADGDNLADVVVGTGEDQASRVRVYLGTNFGGAEPATFQDLDPFAGAVLADGVFVG